MRVKPTDSSFVDCSNILVNAERMGKISKDNCSTYAQSIAQSRHQLQQKSRTAETVNKRLGFKSLGLEEVQNLKKNCLLMSGRR